MENLWVVLLHYAEMVHYAKMHFIIEMISLKMQSKTIMDYISTCFSLSFKTYFSKMTFSSFKIVVLCSLLLNILITTIKITGENQQKN